MWVLKGETIFQDLDQSQLNKKILSSLFSTSDFPDIDLVLVVTKFKVKKINEFAKALWLELTKKKNESFEVTPQNIFLNFKINELYLIKYTLSNIYLIQENYGSHDFGSGKNIIVDFSSSNILYFQPVY